MSFWIYSRALNIRVFGYSVIKSIFQVSTQIEEGGDSSISSREPLEVRRHSRAPLENRCGFRVTNLSTVSGFISVGERSGGVKGGDEDEDTCGDELVAFNKFQPRVKMQVSTAEYQTRTGRGGFPFRPKLGKCSMHSCEAQMGARWAPRLRVRYSSPRANSWFSCGIPVGIPRKQALIRLLEQYSRRSLLLGMHP